MATELKPYPAYKDSGLPWLGSVPENWQLRRTKTILRERSEKGFPDEPLLAATQTKGVVRKEDYENRTVLALKDLQLLKLVRIGDFVISLRSFQGGIEYARDQGIISPAYTILYLVKQEDHAYLAWLFKSASYVQNLTLYVTGIRQGQNIDYEKLSRSDLPIASKRDRAAIVQYLDHADRKVRHAIRARQQLIKLLTEQKQAIIQRAVTRGLDPDVRLKPSGVPWLGDVPEHWQMRRLKYLLREVDERSETGQERLLAVSQYTGVTPRGALRGQGEAITRARSLVGYKRVQLGDLVVNIMLAWNGSLGVAASDGIVSPAYCVYQFHDGLDARYFAALLHTPPCQARIKTASTGVIESRLRLYSDDLGRIEVPIPPVEEQSAIVQYLDVATANLDKAIDAARREIDLLREYRTRLIADVVTGKLDVRDAATYLPDEPEEQPELLDEEPVAETSDLDTEESDGDQSEDESRDA